MFTAVVKFLGASFAAIVIAGVAQGSADAAKPGLIFPIPDGQQWRITQAYQQGTHPGYALDLQHVNGRAATAGQPVRASADGRVTFGGCSSSDLRNGACTGRTNFGLYVRIDHGSGYTSVYAHLSRVARSSGDVRRGDVIGYAGCTGNCTGAHIHFELLLNGRSVNPEPICGRVGLRSGQIVSNCTVAPPPPPPAPIATGDRMNSGQQLLPGQSIVSTNGCFRLIYQSDGNFVLYQTDGHRAIWASNTVGSARNAVMQGDGNLVAYNAAGSARWASNTAGNPGSWLIVQNDGNAVIYRPNGGPAIWATHTVRSCTIAPPPAPSASDRMQSGQQLLAGQSIVSTNGCFRLIYQSDGNLVLYQTNGHRAIWASNTVGSARNAVMQGDGNFVVYNASGAARWASNTNGNPGSWLVVQNDGNLVIYRPNGGPAIWATHTVRSC